MRKCVADLEANGLLQEATVIWCGVFKDIETNEVFKFKPNEMNEMMSFMDTCSELIMHNGIRFDFPLLEKILNYSYKGRKVDTLIMSRLLNPDRRAPASCPTKNAPHSVEAWGYRFGRYKPEHEDWSQFSDEMLHRCSEDVEIQYMIYNALLKEAEDGDWDSAFRLSFKLFENLQKQEDYGWMVDKEYMLSCVDKLQKHIVRIDKAVKSELPLIVDVLETKTGGQYNYVKKPFLKSGKLTERVGNWFKSNYNDDKLVSISGPFTRIDFRPVDLDSNNETKAYLLDIGWQPEEWNYDDAGNKRSAKFTKNDPFNGINNALGKLIARRIRCKQKISIINGLISLIREDGRIPSIVNGLAATGRATHRNIVNIPHAGSFYGKQMRKMFTCKKGWVLVGVDSAGNQVRQLCARMQDESYTKAVIEGKKEDGTDIHSVNMRASQVHSREIAKTFFYGFLFGAGDAKIGKIVNGNAQRGKELKERFLNSLPALKELIENLKEEWRKTAKVRYNHTVGRSEYYDGIIKGLDGRPIKVASEHSILVYLLQSDEAIQMAAAYCKLWQMLCKKYVYKEDFGIVAWYHDEYTIECKPEIAEDIKRIGEECIAWAGRYYNIQCKHEGEGAIGKNWYEIH